MSRGARRFEKRLAARRQEAELERALLDIAAALKEADDNDDLEAQGAADAHALDVIDGILCNVLSE